MTYSPKVPLSTRPLELPDPVELPVPEEPDEPEVLDPAMANGWCV